MFHFPLTTSNGPRPLVQQFYIGSSSNCLATREFNRWSKYKMIVDGQLVQTELAIRWWAKYSNFHCFSAIALTFEKDTILTCATEHRLIAQWQPQLNHPYITDKLALKDTGFMKSNQIAMIQNLVVATRITDYNLQETIYLLLASLLTPFILHSPEENHKITGTLVLHNSPNVHWYLPNCQNPK